MAGKQPVSYTHTKGFDRDKFEAAFEARKNKNLYFTVRYNVAAVNNGWTLVEMMQADSAVIDLRWMAYMLATAFWEASATEKHTVQVAKLGKGRKPVLDADGKPVMIDKTVRVWNAMFPIDEIQPEDKRRYKAPVKVKRIETADADVLRKLNKKFDMADILGGAWIVEKDGDQFVISSDGTQKWKSAKAERGAAFKGKASSTYTQFHGDEHTYIGRGYVQLTWWNSYVTSGVALNRGLDLLFDPSIVKQPQVAYDLMSHGMLTGEGFANGRKISDYIQGPKKDYLHARRMVNAGEASSFKPVADIAELFEQILLECRLAEPGPAAGAPEPLVPGAPAGQPQPASAVPKGQP